MPDEPLSSSSERRNEEVAILRRVIQRFVESDPAPYGLPTVCAAFLMSRSRVDHARAYPVPRRMARSYARRICYRYLDRHDGKRRRYRGPARPLDVQSWGATEARVKKKLRDRAFEDAETGVIVRFLLWDQLATHAEAEETLCVVPRFTWPTPGLVARSSTLDTLAQNAVPRLPPVTTGNVAFTANGWSPPRIVLHVVYERAVEVAPTDELVYGLSSAEITEGETCECLQSRFSLLRTLTGRGAAVKNERYEFLGGGNGTFTGRISADVHLSPQIGLRELPSLLGRYADRLGVRSVTFVYGVQNIERFWEEILLAMEHLDPKPLPIRTLYPEGPFDMVVGAVPGRMNYQMSIQTGELTVTFMGPEPGDLEAAMRSFPIVAFLRDTLGLPIENIV